MEEEKSKSFFDSLGEEIKSVKNIETWGKAFAALGTQANELNKVFTQNRNRIEEMQYAIADAIPGVVRLGGQIGDVTKTIGEIAVASRRNVIENEETIASLYAASNVLGTTVGDLVGSFAEVGVSAEKISDQVESSIYYVQSIGGNAKQVMADVLNNTEKLNRFQFENGVEGLTKMAAQASMMRFDMYTTFQLADKVLSPENAVNVAAAFQRLGVAAGNLVDPFQLMNQSINDPQGLQDSLINVGKQFTYFDEKTKTFKINPEGVLRLREIEEQTGVSAKELTKAGLAAAELDARLSSIKPDIKFAKEEDKQYLANIASMEGGEYVVKLKDEKGEEYSKRLVDVTQDEMDKLIKDQKDAQKPIEEIARDQMGISKLIESDVRAIRDKLLYGIVSSTPAVSGGEALRRGSEAITGTLSQTGKGYMDVQDVRQQANIFYGNIKELFQTKSTEELPKALEEFLQKSGKQFDEIDKSFYNSLQSYAKEVYSKMGDQTSGEKFLKGAMEELNDVINIADKTQGAQVPLGKGLIEGQQSLTSQAISSVNNQSNQMSKVDFGGSITVDVKLPGEFSKVNPQELEQILDRVFNSLEFRQKINAIVDGRATKLNVVPSK
jgi:hypothetical protein